MTSLDVFGTALRLLLRLEELRSSATEQQEIWWFKCKCKLGGRQRTTSSLTIENDTMKDTHALLAFMLVTIGMATTFRRF